MRGLLLLRLLERVVVPDMLILIFGLFMEPRDDIREEARELSLASNPILAPLSMASFRSISYWI